MAASALDFRSVEGALTRYRILAFIVGVLLIVLFAVGIPLQFAADHNGVDAVVGVVHGVIFFPLYIIATADLARRIKMHPIQFVLTAAAGAVPIASFYAEHRTTKLVGERLAAPTHEVV